MWQGIDRVHTGAWSRRGTTWGRCAFLFALFVPGVCHGHWRHPGGLWSLCNEADLVLVVAIPPIADQEEARRSSDNDRMIILDATVLRVIKGSWSQTIIPIRYRTLFSHTTYVPGEYLAFLRGKSATRFDVIGYHDGRFRRGAFPDSEWEPLIRTTEEMLTILESKDTVPREERTKAVCKSMDRALQHKRAGAIVLYDLVPKSVQRDFEDGEALDPPELLRAYCAQYPGTLNTLVRETGANEEYFRRLYYAWRLGGGEGDEAVQLLYSKLGDIPTGEESRDNRYWIAKYLVREAGLEESVAIPEHDTSIAWRSESLNHRNAEIQDFRTRFTKAWPKDLDATEINRGTWINRDKPGDIIPTSEALTSSLANRSRHTSSVQPTPRSAPANCW